MGVKYIKKEKIEMNMMIKKIGIKYLSVVLIPDILLTLYKFRARYMVFYNDKFLNMYEF